MTYVYMEADRLQGTEKVDDEQCVALIKHYTNAPYTGLWRKGLAVKGHRTILKGTAIATFVNGRYPNNGHDNHAAFYIGQNKNDIMVICQWPGDVRNKPTVSSRIILFQGNNLDGSFIEPSNNGDACSIIE